MAAKFKRPGVYVEEVSTFPNSVAEVPTAIPVFIGYTEKAHRNGNNLVNRAIKITSFSEYELNYGGAFKSKFSLLRTERNESRPVLKINGNDYAVNYEKNQKAYMHPSIKLFYANGGRECYIVAVGTYEGKDNVEIKREELLGHQTVSGGLKALNKTKEPTIVVLPDAVNLGDDCYKVYQDVLKHCNAMKSRVAILDVHDGYKKSTKISESIDGILNFRDKIGSDNLSFGAAYYPWLQARIVYKSTVTFENLHLSDLLKLLPENASRLLIKNYLKGNNHNEKNKQKLHSELVSTSPTYLLIIDAIHKLLNLLPPSSAIAGIYTRVDRERGVWKAPANVSITSVAQPAISITDKEEDLLNSDTRAGKSINAIKLIHRRGILVWGARTLAGHHHDFKYINVRRTVIHLEQSIQMALKKYVFEPNDKNTWTAVKGMINNFLTLKWRQGALVGTKQEEAFGVAVGLGSTMTTLDILNGKMLVTAFVALLRPAEFIVMSFEQKMKSS